MDQQVATDDARQRAAQFRLRLREVLHERRVLGPLGSMASLMLFFVGIPMSSVVIGSWGQISRHGVAPIRVYLLVVVAIAVTGLAFGVYLKGVLILVRWRWARVSLLAIPTALAGTCATLFAVLHNWPGEFLYGLTVDVRVIQVVLSAGLFSAAAIAVVRFRIHGVLAAVSTLAMLTPFVPLQLQQGGFRASRVGAIVAPGTVANGNVLWIIPDELTASAMFNSEGRVWDGLPNLARLQQTSTTYVRAVSVSINTSQAVPAMLGGISDLRTVESGDLASLAESKGVLTALTDAMEVRYSSPFFASLDQSSSKSLYQRVVGRNLTVLHSVLSVSLDLLFSPRIEDLVTGPRGFIGRFFADSDADFWGTEGQRSNAALDEFDRLLAEQADSDPWFFLWHSLDTHYPWNVDQDGHTMFAFADERACSGNIPCSPLKSLDGAPNGQWSEVLSRRLYSMSVQFFDRRVGRMMSALEAAGELDRTTIVIGADHGTAVANVGGGRHTAMGSLMVDGVIHVPLLVKFPDQRTPIVVNDLVSMGQIMSTVLDSIEVDLEVSGYEMSPMLPRADATAASTARPVELGTWTGYDDFWSWRSQTWLPVSDVGWYGGGDWFGGNSDDEFDHLGFPQVIDSPDRTSSPIEEVRILPLDGKSEVVFVALVYPKASCGGTPWIELSNGRFVESKVGLQIDGATDIAWVAVPRSDLDRLSVSCRVG